MGRTPRTSTVNWISGLQGAESEVAESSQSCLVSLTRSPYENVLTGVGDLALALVWLLHWMRQAFGSLAFVWPLQGQQLEGSCRACRSCVLRPCLGLMQVEMRGMQLTHFILSLGLPRIFLNLCPTPGHSTLLPETPRSRRQVPGQRLQEKGLGGGEQHGPLRHEVGGFPQQGARGESQPALVST